MTSDRPGSAPDMDALAAQTAHRAQHRELLAQANAALAASPAPALLDSVHTLHGIVLAADPGALRRSVGWFGRLLGRDITLQSEADALRDQLGVHVLQARQHVQALADSNQTLDDLGRSLQTAIDELDRQSAQLADPGAIEDAAASGRRLQQLTTLTTSLRITASHIGITAHHHRELIQHVRQMLPQVELLLDQQRMLQSGLTGQTALQAATRSIQALQSVQPLTLPDDATPR